MFTLEEIMALITKLDQSSIQHFELEEGKQRLVLSKEGKAGAVIQPLAGEAIPPSREKTAAPLAAQEQQAPKETNYKITAPMLGTFYTAASPEAQPFVKVGQKVKADTVVCVLEAMKLFNEVEAGISGEIIEILANNEDFVEYGQPLFVVKPDET